MDQNSPSQTEELIDLIPKFTKKVTNPSWKKAHFSSKELVTDKNKNSPNNFLRRSREEPVETVQLQEIKRREKQQLQSERLYNSLRPNTSRMGLGTQRESQSISNFTAHSSGRSADFFESTEGVRPTNLAPSSNSSKISFNISSPLSPKNKKKGIIRQSLVAERLAYSNSIRFIPRTVNSSLGNSNSPLSSPVTFHNEKEEKLENYNGKRLLDIHRELKTFDLKQKSERQVETKISDLTRKMRKDLLNILFEIHLLSKKIQILDSDGGNHNIENLSTEKLDPEQTLLSYKSNETILSILTLIRENPIYLVHALAYNGLLEPQAAKDLTKYARVLVISVFRSCICPYEERLLGNFLLKLSDYQLHVSTTEIQFTGIYDYLTAIFQPFVMGLIQDSELILEVDPESQEVLYQKRNPNAKKHLQTILSDFFEIVREGLDSFPLQLRDLVCHIYRSCQEKGKNGLLLVKQLIFDHFILQALKEPQFYLQLVGVDLHIIALHNIKSLRMAISEISVEESFLNEYLMHLVTPDSGNFVNIIESDPLGQRSYTFTKSEWELIFQLFERLVQEKTQQNSFADVPSPITGKDDPLEVLLNRFLTLTRQEKKYSSLNPRKYIKLEEPYVFKATNAPPSEKPSKEARKSFIQVLSDVSFLPRFETKRSMIDYLSIMGASSLNKDKVSLLSSSKLLILSLQSLPPRYREKDYSHFLDLVEEDIRFMKEESSNRQSEILHAWDQLQHCFWKMSAQRRLLEDYFTSKKLKDFRRKSFGTIQNEFVDNFIEIWSKTENTDFCECKWSTRTVCSVHEKQSTSVKDFIATTKKALAASVLWKTSSEEEIHSAAIQLERSVMGKLHHLTFCNVNQEDIELNKLIHKTEGKVDLEDFQIPKAFHHEAPWVFAQIELSKMNNYTAPFDKLQCLSRCWQVISRGVSLLDDAGPDACLSIMLYVIYAVDMKNNWGNLLYIESFSSPLDPELMSGRTGAMRTALRGLTSMLNEIKERINNNNNSSATPELASVETSNSNKFPSSNVECEDL